MLSSIFGMNGYGGYVVTAYGVAFIILGLHIISSIRRYRNIKRLISKNE